LSVLSGKTRPDNVELLWTEERKGVYNMQSMENKIIKTAMVEWKKLDLFQPADLKKMTEQQINKLKTSFIKNGFKSPFYVWQDSKKLWCLDGHTRIPILRMLEEEGYDIPNKLPANFIDCKNKKEAKKAVLIYNSHYADIKQDIFEDWIKDLNLDEIISEIDIKGIDLDFKIGEDIDAEPQIDKAEELRVKWGVKSGQL